MNVYKLSNVFIVLAKLHQAINYQVNVLSTLLFILAKQIKLLDAGISSIN